jgi:hypothetical protein
MSMQESQAILMISPSRPADGKRQGMDRRINSRNGTLLEWVRQIPRRIPPSPLHAALARGNLS